MSVPQQDVFRAVMARFVTGVTVLTATDAAGHPHGMTANAVTSVSLDPLLVLVCVARDTTMCGVVQEAGGFSLSFLAADQGPLSDHFADPERPFGDAEFDGMATTPGTTGALRLAGATAWLDCEVHDLLDGGDHVLVLGRVRSAEPAPGAPDVLLYTPTGYDRWPT